MNSRPRIRGLHLALLVTGLLLLGGRSGHAYGADESMGPEFPVRGSAIGRIEIPRLRIGAIVAEGSDLQTLKHAVGHITSTALPGSPGNCALAGHRDTFLRGLGRIRVNDLIRVVTPERAYTYQVEWTEVVEPHHVEVLDSTATRSLTLITCYPFAFVGHAPRRFVVRARQVQEVEEPPEVSARRPRHASAPIPSTYRAAVCRSGCTGFRGFCFASWAASGATSSDSTIVALASPAQLCTRIAGSLNT